MKNRQCSRIAGMAVFLVVVLQLGVARADTDYRCLKLCAGNGKSNAACLKNCTYDGKDSERALDQTTRFLPNHRVLQTLQPTEAGQLQLKGVAKTAPPTASKDYKCMSQCLQSKLQYQTCSTSCTQKNLDSQNQLVPPVMSQ